MAEDVHAKFMTPTPITGQSSSDQPVYFEMYSREDNHLANALELC